MTDINPFGVLRNAILLAITLLLLWFLSPFSDYFERAGVTLHAVVANSLIFLLSVASLFSFYFVVEFIFISPFRLEKEQRISSEEAQGKLIALEKRSSPNLKIELDGNGNLSRIYDGTTSETHGGHRYVSYTGWQDAACLLCTNTGQSVANNCQARLTRVWQFEDSGAKEIRILESLPLGWDRKLTEGTLSANILPNETKRLYIGSVRPNGAMGLWQKLDLQPIEYHLMFKDPGHYRLEIAISMDERAPTLIHLDIETKIDPPEPNKIGKGNAVLKLSDPITVS